MEPEDLSMVLVEFLENNNLDQVSFVELPLPDNRDGPGDLVSCMLFGRWNKSSCSGLLSHVLLYAWYRNLFPIRSLQLVISFKTYLDTRAAQMKAPKLKTIGLGNVVHEVSILCGGVVQIVWTL